MSVIDRGVFHKCNIIRNYESIDTFFVSFSPFYKKVEEEAKDKRNIMVQWMNFGMTVS